MVISTTNEEQFQAIHSPYHPKNLMRAKLLKGQISDFGSTNDTKIEVVTSIYDLEDDWRRIEAEDHVSVHQSFNWCRAWCNNHDIEPIFVTVSINSHAEFILPLEIHSQFGIKFARFLGSDHSNLNYLLASKAYLLQMKPNFIDEFRKELKKIHLPFDVIYLEKMRLDFGGLPNPFSYLTKTLNQNASFQLPLLGTSEETFAQINAKRKRKIVRTTARKLGKIGEQKYIISSNIAENERIILAFFSQKAKSFKNKGLPNTFGTNDIQSFLIDLCALEQGDIGNLELHAITLQRHDQSPQVITPEVIAIAAMTVKNGHAICQFGSFEEEIASKTHSSPGETLFYQVIENMVLRRMTLFDFGIGDQPYKRSWCTICTKHYDGFIILNISGYIGAILRKYITVFKRIFKSSPQLFKFANKFRK